MKIEVAQEKDSDELKSLLAHSSLKGPIEYRLERPKSFFDLYRLQTSDYETHVIRDDEGVIQGMATLLFRPAYIAGEMTTIGWATDLRILPNRKAIQSWTEHFLPITQSALRKRNARYLFSVISSVDSTIQNALIRPRAQRRQIPTYHLLKRATHRNLSFAYSEELLRWRFQHWPGFRIDSFLLAKDRRGNIVGCVAPWSPRSIQKIIPHHYDPYERTIRSALKVGSALKWSVQLPETGSEMEVEFLTHLHADNPDIFGCLLEEAYRLKSPRGVLVYPHFHRYPQTLPPRQFLYDRTLAGLYVVTLGDEDLPEELQPNLQNLPPELELALF